MDISPEYSQGTGDGHNDNENNDTVGNSIVSELLGADDNDDTFGDDHHDANNNITDALANVTDSIANHIMATGNDEEEKDTKEDETENSHSTLQADGGEYSDAIADIVGNIFSEITASHADDGQENDFSEDEEAVPMDKNEDQNQLDKGKQREQEKLMDIDINDQLTNQKPQNETSNFDQANNNNNDVHNDATNKDNNNNGKDNDNDNKNNSEDDDQYDNENNEEIEEDEDEDDDDSHFDIGSAVNDAIAQIVNQTINDTADEGNHESKDSRDNSMVQEEVESKDDKDEEMEDAFEDSQITSNFEDAISKMVSETVNQISESNESNKDNIDEEMDQQTHNENALQSQEDDARDSMNNVMNDTIAQLVSDTISQAKQHSDASKQMEKPSEEEDMSSTEMLISGAVNEIMKNVSAEAADSTTRTSDITAGAGDLGDDAIAQIVESVVQSIPRHTEEISGDKPLQQSNDDFQLAMNEMIRSVADEIVSDDEADPNDLQFAIEEMVKNVVDETYEDHATSVTPTTRTSLIDSLLSNSELTNSIVANTLNQRRLSQQIGDSKYYRKPLDLAEELLKNRSVISAREYANTPNLRDLLNKHASQAVASGLNTTLPYRTSFYSGNYAKTEGPHTASSITTSLSKNLNQLDKGAKASITTSRLSTTRTPSSGQSPMTQSMVQALDSVIQKILSNSKLASALQIDDKEKTRLDNRTRKQKWREKNNARNKDNDLRFRVSKRASTLFGENESEEKRKWINEEFDRRKAKRIERLKKMNKDDNAVYTTPNARRKSAANTITSGLLSLVNSTKLSELSADTTQELNSAINNALETVNLSIDMSHEQLTSAVTQYLANFFHLNVSKSSSQDSESPQSSLSNVNSKVLPPSSTPDRELTSLVKSNATGGSVYSRNNTRKSFVTSNNKPPNSSIIDPSIMALGNKESSTSEDVNKDLSKVFSDISLLPSKRKPESEKPVSSNKRPDAGAKSDENLSTSNVKSVTSFRLPIYRKNISSSIVTVVKNAAKTTSSPVVNSAVSDPKASASIKPALNAFNDANKKTDGSSAVAAKELSPNVGSSTSTSSSAQQANSGAKTVAATASSKPSFVRPKKPSILSTLDMQRPRPRPRPSLNSILAKQTGGGTPGKPRIGMGSFRRPLYKSTTSN
ncbi:hypothetical protein DASC09_037400 [Saccharomycopsis crataegensis]|uniref:DUF3020 domain-containing protein n=1 Tax=Saccharomycopsis crataegensis TaxID=43959 RepID=A0AAV5QNB7_9ASCO|nr:hypothetical protein DASC09_037400 [Saccharomycopsis crataegensis]